MPYQSVSELPDNVKNALPQHAQDIYKESFNSASEEYKKPGDRRGEEDREEVSHKVAWSAVKRAGYEKSDDDKWHKTS